MSKVVSKDFIFTRYLYEKEEVEIAFVLSLLYKKEDESLFWAYELYYSGFYKDLSELLWKVYYDFYASCNPAFEIYLHKKITEILTEKKREDRTLGIVIQNFLIRPFNMDVFFLRLNIAKIHDVVVEGVALDYKKLMYDVFISGKECRLLLEEYYLQYACADPKSKTIEKIIKEYEKAILRTPFIDKHVIVLCKILHLYGLNQNKKMGKNIYICSSDSDGDGGGEYIMYETILAEPKEQLPAYKILSLGALYEINQFNCLHLFTLKRETFDIRAAYLHNWLYYASRSPCWAERIREYGGQIMVEERKVVFLDDDRMEEFYQQYGYEPDEQRKEVQNKSILEIVVAPLEKRTWRTVYEECGFTETRFFEIDVKRIQ